LDARLGWGSFRTLTNIKRGYNSELPEIDATITVDRSNEGAAKFYGEEEKTRTNQIREAPDARPANHHDHHWNHYHPLDGDLIDDHHLNSW
jgi:hypothetical protein